MRQKEHYRPKRLAPASDPPPSYGGPGAVGPRFDLYILPENVGVVTEEDLERFPPVSLGNEEAARAFLDRALAPAPKKRSLLRDLAFYALLALLVAGAFLLRSAAGSTPVSFAGFSAMRVLTSSMQDEIPQGSLIITRRVDPLTLEIGDDITYMAAADATVTHRIIAISENYQGSGQRAFTTQGIMNRDPDELRVPAANVVGKVIFHNLALGQALEFIRAQWVWLTILLALLVGLYEALKIVFQESRAEAEAHPAKRLRQ